MFSILKKNIWASVLLSVLTVAAILLLVNGLIKGIFILSNESAVQKATPMDIVLGTLSLGLVLLSIVGINGAVFLALKKQEFNKHVIMTLLGASLLLIISGLLVIVKDHISYTTDWKKLNDINQARFDIGSNLSLLHTLVDDKFGNKGYIIPGSQQNTLAIADYDNFLNQMIASKKDLAALYPIDELLNTAHQPLLAGKLVDAMAAAWQHDTTHTLTVASWMASSSTANAYDFQNVISTLKVDFSNDGQLHKIINGLMNQPIVYTGITTAYLQGGFPLGITGVVIAVTHVAGTTALLMWKKEYKPHGFAASKQATPISGKVGK